LEDVETRKIVLPTASEIVKIIKKFYVLNGFRGEVKCHENLAIIGLRYNP
jgi:hypothetical protein